jgi:ribosomal subunit interface protein
VDIIFKGRHTDVLERFRKHATAKLTKIERLYAKAIRVDVEVSAERNPRQSGRKERVELTITSSGPAIRAEAAAEDRFAALDMALARLESRLRRASNRRKGRHGARATIRLTDPQESGDPAPPEPGARAEPGTWPGQGTWPEPGAGAEPGGTPRAAADEEVPAAARVLRAPRGRVAPDDVVPIEPDDVVPIEMEGDGPLVVREKFHGARPMALDQALLEMELVGHDFFLFRDVQGGLPSVVYRRFGYQYGVIRLVEEPAEPASGEPRRTAVRAPRGRLANGQAKNGAQLRLG